MRPPTRHPRGGRRGDESLGGTGLGRRTGRAALDHLLRLRPGSEHVRERACGDALPRSTATGQTFTRRSLVRLLIRDDRASPHEWAGQWGRDGRPSWRCCFAVQPRRWLDAVEPPRVHRGCANDDHQHLRPRRYVLSSSLRRDRMKVDEACQQSAGRLHSGRSHWRDQGPPFRQPDPQPEGAGRLLDRLARTRHPRSGGQPGLEVSRAAASASRPLIAAVTWGIFDAFVVVICSATSCPDRLEAVQYGGWGGIRALMHVLTYTSRSSAWYGTGGARPAERPTTGEQCSKAHGRSLEQWRRPFRRSLQSGGLCSTHGARRIALVCRSRSLVCKHT